MQEFLCNHFFPKNSKTIDDSLYISEDEYITAHCQLFSEARLFPSTAMKFLPQQSQSLISIIGLQYKLHLDKYNINVKYNEVRDKNKTIIIKVNEN